MKNPMNKAYSIFAHFLVRDGWSFYDAKWEIAFLRKQNININMSEREMKDAYFPKIRLGAKKRLNRKDKIGIILTLQNAMNHSYFPEAS